MTHHHTLSPLHEPTDPEKVQSLRASLTAHGWIGAPLVLWSEDTGELITGAHRFAAADSLGWEHADIPIVLLADVFEDAGLDLDTALAENDWPALPFEWWRAVAVLNELPVEVRERYGIDAE